MKKNTAVNAETVYRVMKENSKDMVSLLERWQEFGQNIINSAFHHGGVDADELAALATILIEDTEDVIE